MIFRFVFAVSLLWVLSFPVQAQTIIRDQEIEDALRTFAAPIFDRAGLTPQNVRFIIIKSDDLNAFVAGGQNIFFYTGLLLATENVGELLGVLAHETGHIADGHLLQTKETIDRISVQAILANLLGAAIAIGGGGGEGAVAATSLGSSLTTRMYLRHSRTQESAADNAGVRFLEESHLPLEGFVTFMEKLADQELLPESQQNAYVRTHPISSDRVAFLREQKETSTAGNKMPEMWNDIHARIKAKLEGYLFPDRALGRKGDDIASTYGRAIALYRTRKVDQSLSLIDSLIAKEKDNPYFYEFKGQVLFENGRIPEAVSAYRQAVSLRQNSALMRTAYAHALIESNDASHQDEAEKQLQQSLRIDPQQPSAHRFLAIINGKRGDEGLSRLHLAEAAVLQGNRDVARREAGLAKTKLKEKTPAWQRVADILDYLDSLESDKK